MIPNSSIANTLILSPIKQVRGSVQLPSSKSLSNRALLLAALAEGSTWIQHLLVADDVVYLAQALQQLGVTIAKEAPSITRVEGVSGQFPVMKADLFLGNAGTALRPLTAVLALMKGAYTVAGVPRMHQRPIGDLVDALRALGSAVDYLENPGTPPLRIKPFVPRRQQRRDSARALLQVQICASLSSQFLSALLLALPLLGRAACVDVVGPWTSKPYVRLTQAMMQAFSVAVEQRSESSFYIAGKQCYRSPGHLSIEGDASSASYFLAAAAIAGGPVRVCGLSLSSLQPDCAFVDVLKAMGVSIQSGADWIEAHGPRARLRPLNANLGAMPDAAMTAAVVALFADGTSHIRNIGSWRVKETDRLAAMARALSKVGAVVCVTAETLSITPPIRWVSQVAFDTEGDHRMAMSLSLIALAGVTVQINNPACVAKTFPDYFEVFETLCERGC